MATILNLKDDVRYYCFGSGVDMRKGINSLYGLIKQDDNLSALDGDVYVFIGTNCKSAKILTWQTNGFVLYHKKLELGRFNLPQNTDRSLFFELTSNNLDKLLTIVRHRSIGGELKRVAILSV